MVGRPSLYDPEVHPEQARKLCLLGATDADLAEFFEVDERTINNWKIEHPEFFQSLKDGKEQADANVADRLYKRAMGYSHPAVKIFQHEGRPVYADYTEHYPPDTAAAIFWLKNRKSGKWREKIEHTGADGGPMVVQWASK